MTNLKDFLQAVLDEMFHKETVIYNNGNVGYDFTTYQVDTGWNYRVTANSTNGALSIATNSGSYQLLAQIDVTKYSKLIFNNLDFIKGPVGNAQACICDLSRTIIKSQAFSSTSHLDTAELDISELTGEYLIGLYIYGNGESDSTMKCESIILK